MFDCVRKSTMWLRGWYREARDPSPKLPGSLTCGFLDQSGKTTSPGRSSAEIRGGASVTGWGGQLNSHSLYLVLVSPGTLVFAFAALVTISNVIFFVLQDNKLLEARDRFLLIITSPST